MARYSQLMKLTLKDLGNPNLIAAQPDNITEMHLGTLYARSGEFVIRASPDNNQEFEGLKGEFRMVPTNMQTGEPETDEAKIKESGILFIPEAFHNLVADQLRSALANDPKSVVEFGFDVYVIRAKNKQGYSWRLVPVIDRVKPSMLDTLIADHRKMLAAPKHENVKQIAGKK